jgi:hypothetical protein
MSQRISSSIARSAAESYVVIDLVGFFGPGGSTAAAAAAPGSEVEVGGAAVASDVAVGGATPVAVSVSVSGAAPSPVVVLGPFVVG